MSDTQKIMQALAAPFPGSSVHWRPQGNAFKRDGRFFARVVAYVDARDVMERLDDVLGMNWQSRTTETAKGRVMCAIGITLPDGREIWRDDGAGDTAIEGEKGAISDAFKRAAVRFGIARYLYALPSPAVEVEAYETQKNGKTVFVPRGICKEAREKLAALAHRSLERWEADLRAMDQSEPDGPPPAPPPKPALKRETPKAPEERAPAPRQRAEAQAEREEGRHFPIPTFRREAAKEERAEAWKAWSRQLMAAVKASADRDEALRHIAANEKGLAAFSRDSGNDARALVMAVVNRRWPIASVQPAKGSPLEIALPATQTKRALDAWAEKVARFARGAAETAAQLEEIIAANAEGIQRASAALEMDVAEAIRGDWESQHLKGAVR